MYNSNIKKKILIVSANPVTTRPLCLEQEKRDIELALERSIYRDFFSIEISHATRIQDFRRLFIDYKKTPNILHFCGHGNGDSGLVFEDNDGKSKYIKGIDLADFLSLFSDYLDCVFLNACYSEVQASEIQKHVNCVIGMKEAIGDKSAREFAVGFYEALFSGKSYDFAYNYANKVIKLDDDLSELKPILLLRNPMSNKTLINFDKFNESNELNSLKENSKVQDVPIFHNNFVLTNSHITSHDISTTYFTGRETEIIKLKEHIKNGDKICITGMGGIGKTTLCKHLYDMYVKEYKNNTDVSIDNIGFFTYDTSLETTIYKCLDFDKSNDLELDTKLALNNIYTLSNEKRVVLFIDNVTNYDIEKLNNINCAVIITTRNKDIYDFVEFPLDRLTEAECIDIFQKIVGIEIVEKDILKYIVVDRAGRHTLTIKLLAYVMKSKGWSIIKLREELNNKKFKVEFRHKNKEIAIHKELEKLFDISGLLDDEINVLEAFSIFPYNIQIPYEDCHNWLNQDANIINDKEMYKILHDKGWLELGNKGYFMHPVISEMLIEKQKPLYENHTNLCKSFANDLHNKDVYKEMAYYIPIGEYIIKYIYNENEDVSLIFYNLGYFYNSYGNYQKALEWYEKALVIREKVLGIDHPSTANTYNNIALVYHSQGDYQKALEWHEKSLVISEKVLGKDHPSTAITYNNIAFVYDSQGEYQKALEWYEKALVISEKVLGKDHPDTATTYNNIAVVYSRFGEYQKALEWYEKALVISEKMLGKDHPSTANTYNNIAFVYDSQGEYQKALEWYEKALVIREKVLGKDHPDTSNTYNNIAVVYSRFGEYQKALEWYEKALVISEKVLGKDHPDTATTYNNIAFVYSHLGEYQKALEWYEKALVIREKVLGKDHPDTANTYNNIAVVYDSQGEYQKALEWYEKALVIQEKVLGKDHPSTSNTYNNIAVVYDSQGEYQKALEWYEKALVIREKVLGKDHPDTATTYNNIAVVYDGQGEYQKALEWYEKALVIREKVLGKDHPDTATTYNNIAGVYDSFGEYQKALKWYEKALVIREKVLGKNHPDTATTYNNIAGVYDSFGEYQKALKWYEKALVIREKVLGKNHPSTILVINNIKVVQVKIEK